MNVFAGARAHSAEAEVTEPVRPAHCIASRSIASRCIASRYRVPLHRVPLHRFPLLILVSHRAPTVGPGPTWQEKTLKTCWHMLLYTIPRKGIERLRHASPYLRAHNDERAPWPAQAGLRFQPRRGCGPVPARRWSGVYSFACCRDATMKPKCMP